MFDWMLFINVGFVLAIVIGLYYSPSPEILILIVAIGSLVFYGMGRYWRHMEGFLTRRS
jgi:hypothetical protein